jgi:hypothetical protein
LARRVGNIATELEERPHLWRQVIVKLVLAQWTSH